MATRVATRGVAATFLISSQASPVSIPLLTHVANRPFRKLPFANFAVCNCAVGLVVAGLVVTTLSTFGSLVLQGYLGVNTTGPGRFLVREK